MTARDDSVTIPVWLYERMAEVYYGQKYGIDVPPTGRIDLKPPSIDEPREHHPASAPEYLDHLRDVEVLNQRVPSSFVPRGAAARKLSRTSETAKDPQKPQVSPPTESN